MHGRSSHSLESLRRGNAGVNAGEWSLLTRIAFRFCFIYLLPLGLGCISIFAEVTFRHSHLGFWKFYTLDPWYKVMPWVCRHVFHVQREIRVYPDSDLLSGYLQHLLELIVALVGTAVWSFLDRRRKHYRCLYGWFALYLRFCLSITLCSYGFAKVVPNQFGALTPSRIMQPVGSLSLFEMLWTFMAASKGYTIFSGFLEVSGGVLLLIPRLETLGALISFLVLTNVFVLNLFYNVGVLIFSSHLLFIAVFLAAPALMRILDLVVLRRSVTPVLPVPLSKRRSINRGVYTSVIVLGLVLCFCTASVNLGYAAEHKAQESEIPYLGAWTADTFVVGTTGKEALFTEKLAKEMKIRAGEDHWVRLYFEYRIFSPKDTILIELKNGILDEVNLKYDASTAVALLNDTDDPDWKVTLALKSPGKDLLELNGTVNGIQVTATFHREDMSRFPLTQDGIHFIKDD